MRHPVCQRRTKHCLHVYLLFCFILSGNSVLQAQSCPASVSTSISSYPNTYYPGLQATVSAGSTSIVIGAATYGSTPISVGDILLIIQVQGAQLVSNNDGSYGDGASGSGYLANAQLLAGNMEYVVAANAVPLSGGTLSLQSPTTKTYANAGFGADGQYTYEVIHVPSYYNLSLGSTLRPPDWDGATGGVLVVNVVNVLDMNGQTIDASGAGFRGGGGVLVNGWYDNGTDFVVMSPTNFYLGVDSGDHASKGEGIAGTPRLVNSNNYGFLTINTAEGYPNGSFAMGAPGNAGGGGTDFFPTYQNDNSGGGGGGNGGQGGKGGNSFWSDQPVGGNPGAVFAQSSPSLLVMGGGGGAGCNNNNTGNLGAFSSSGAAGGGIVIIYAGSIVNPGIINVNGIAGDNSVGNDGAGGGGAGGSVLLHAGSGHANITVYANGGNGGTNSGFDGAAHYAHGPGGGGGGGVIYADGAVNAASSVDGGLPGSTEDDWMGIGNYGAAAGTAGIINTGATVAAPLVCTTLPMHFLSVEGVNNDGRISVKWQVANEINVRHYIIERAENTGAFFTTGTVDYKAGDSVIGEYSFSDPSPAKDGTIYYRIKAEDMDGRYIVSKIIAMEATAGNGAMTISPNPASRSSVIYWSAAGNAPVTISLFDATGHEVFRQQYTVRTGINELLLTNLSVLPDGFYLVQGYDGRSKRSGKLLVWH